MNKRRDFSPCRVVHNSDTCIIIHDQFCLHDGIRISIFPNRIWQFYYAPRCAFHPLCHLSENCQIYEWYKAFHSLICSWTTHPCFGGKVDACIPERMWSQAHRRADCMVKAGCTSALMESWDIPAASFPPAKAWQRSSRCRERAEVPERYCGSPRHPCWLSVMENKNDPQEICLLCWLCQTSTSTSFILVHKRRLIAQYSGWKCDD